MLDTADILIDVHPIGGLGRVGRGLGMRGGEPRKIPRRIHERVHRVRLAPRAGPARGAGAVPPCGMAVKWIARRVKVDIIGQFDRQVLFLLGHKATGGAMHHRNGASPVALARDAPVAQAIVGDAAAVTSGLGHRDGRDHRRLTRLQRLPGKAAHIAHALGFHRHEGFGQRGLVRAFCHKHRLDRQSVFGGKLEIPRVMGRAAENRARAIIHQDEVGDIDRQFPGGVQGMPHPHPGIHSQLFRRLHRLGTGATLATLRDKGGNGGVFGFQCLC